MEENIRNESNKFWFKLKLAFLIILTWWLVSFVNLYLNISLQAFSLQPHSDSFVGILTYPFIHGDLEHLINNSLSGFLIFSSLFLVYEKLSIKVIALVYLFSGIILWFIGEKNSMHIGASSIIYGIAFFLFFSGLLTRESSKIATSLFIVAWYGSMIWGILPYTVEDGISWEGHLSGAIVGVVLALMFHKDYLKFEVGGEDEEEEFHFYERFPLEDNEIEE